MSKKLIKTLASITCGLGMALAIPSFVSSCGNSTFDADPEKLNIQYYGSYLLWGATQFDITEDDLVTANYDGQQLKSSDFEVSYKSDNEDLSISFEKLENGYKFKVDSKTPSGDYEFNIGVTYGDETIYSRTFYLSVRNFIPLQKFKVTENTLQFINVSEDYSTFDGIYVPDKLNGVVINNVNLDNTYNRLSSIKTLAFDCESEVTQLNGSNYLSGLEVLELPKKLQGVACYSLSCENTESSDESTPLKKLFLIMLVDQKVLH